MTSVKRLTDSRTRRAAPRPPPARAGSATDPSSWPGRQPCGSSTSASRQNAARSTRARREALGVEAVGGDHAAARIDAQHALGALELAAARAAAGARSAPPSGASARPRLGVVPAGAAGRRRCARASAARCRAGGPRRGRRAPRARRPRGSGSGGAGAGRRRRRRPPPPARATRRRRGLVARRRRRRRRRGPAHPGDPRRTGASARRRDRSAPRGRRSPRRSCSASPRPASEPRHDRDVAAVRGQLAGERAGHVRRAAAGEEHQGAEHAHPLVVPEVVTRRRERDHGRDRSPAGQHDAVVLARDVAQPPGARPARSSRRRRG